jgi:hypothetical protein
MLATEKQIAYIRDLGGKPHDGLTKQEASQLIENLLAVRSSKRKQAQGPSVAISNTVYSCNTPDPNTKWGCLILIVISLIAGCYFYFRSDQELNDKDAKRSIQYSPEYLTHAGVFISQHGSCYHLFPDCISLDNPNAYVQVTRVPRISVNLSHRPCEICHRNAPYVRYRLIYGTNDYSVGTGHLSVTNSCISSTHHLRGPGNIDEFSPLSSIWNLLLAGFNIEFNGAWEPVDIWGPDGIHYNTNAEITTNTENRASAWMWLDER